MREYWGPDYKNMDILDMDRVTSKTAEGVIVEEPFHESDKAVLT